MKLTPVQQQQLAVALRSAFYRWELLKQLLQYGLGVSLDDIAARGPLVDVAFDIIQWAENSGRIQELIEKAFAANRGNPELRSFVLELPLGPASAVPTTSPLWREVEKTVLARVKFLNPAELRARAERAERTVCRFVLPKPEWGTGFLVGPDTVLTNYHVIEDAHIGLAKPEQVDVEFDFVYGPDGKAPAAVTTCKLAAENWLLAFSKEGIKDADLDFALVRLDRAMGEEPAPGQPPVAANEPAPKRGWLTPTGHDFNAAEAEPLFILQHPQENEDKPTEPLKVTVGFVNGAPTASRVHYTTNTLKGSSGSPCFRSDWELVALHHAATQGNANEGIPLKAILRDLAGREPPVALGKKVGEA